MYCQQCGTEIGDDAAFCSKCGDKIEGIGRPKWVWFVVAAAIVILAGVGVAVGISATSDRGTEVAEQDAEAVEGEVSEEVAVPDFFALGGESAFSVRLSLNFDEENMRHYGDLGFEEEYRRIAEDAGLKVELVSMDEYEDGFDGGWAGWPQGQQPAPGEVVSAGSTVTLIVVDDVESMAETAAMYRMDEEYAGVPITTLAKGSPDRSQIMDAIRSSYGNTDMVFLVHQLRVMKDYALAEVSPTPETDDYRFGRCICLTVRGPSRWEVFATFPTDDSSAEQYLRDSRSAPVALLEDFFRPRDALVAVPDMSDFPGLYDLDLYSGDYSAQAARLAEEYLSTLGLASDYEAILGLQGAASQDPAPGEMVPPGTVVRVRVYITG